MRGLPKSRLKRIAWRLRPKHLAEYWFSRDGGIMALKIAGIAILIMFVMTLGVFAYFRKDLPDISVSGNLGGSISYYDRSGKILLWQDYNAVKRVPVKTEDISPYLKKATVAIEDKDFYNHRGFDIRGITRAMVNDVVKHGSTQGGSTITQQLVKINLDWTQQRSITRKVKELILAVELERSYTKDDILTGYLNAAPYGGVDYGAQAAASDYFHKSAKDLTLAQAAMLAAIPKAPSIYSPYDKDYFDKNAFLARQHYVLDVMVQQKIITKAQADAAKKEDVLAEVQPQQTKYAGIKAPYFVLAARNELNKKFTCSNSAGCNKIGGWRVTTTLDMNLQNKAEDLVNKNYSLVSRYGADEEALVAEDVKTGQMVALVGGTDFNNPDHGEINYAQINISPGSSFKPYDYTALIDNSTNAGAGSVLYDVQQPLSILAR
jgi:membrane peptidoglycan carboxypeptidase